MTDDLGEFRAPAYRRRTPTAIKAAGKRLYDYATEHQVPNDIPIVDMVLVGEPDEVEALARDQRLLAWFVSLS